MTTITSSTSSTDFSGAGTVYSSATPNNAVTSLAVLTLDLNTTYYLRVSADWGGYFGTARTTPISTATLANEPGAAVPAILEVQASSISAQWTAGAPPNPPDTRYALEASTSANFTGTEFSSTAVVGWR